VGRLGGSGNNGGNRDGSRSRSTLALIVGRADTATVGDELRNVWAKTSFSSGGVREGGALSQFRSDLLRPRCGGGSSSSSSSSKGRWQGCSVGESSVQVRSTR
jgi:hypothetical protein